MTATVAAQAPGRVTEATARWVRHPVVGAAGAGLAGLAIQLAGYGAGWAGQSGALPLTLFFVGLVVLVAPSTWVLVGRRATPNQRLGAGLVLALLLYLSFFLSSPLVTTRTDETLHVATLMSLLRGAGLPAHNGSLAVSPYYPGLELVTSSAFWLTGLPVVVCQALVVVVARVLLVVTLYLLVQRYSRSARAGGLAVLVYCASSQFYFFNAQFAYQTLAIGLFLGVVYLVQRALDAGERRQRLGLLAGLTGLAAAVAVTHHLTSWAAVGLLWLWAAGHLLNRRPDRARVVAAAAAAATAVTGVWTLIVGSRLVGYLGPLFRQAESQLAHVITGSSGSRKFFVDQSGYRTPFWEALVMALSVAVWLALVALAFRAIAEGRLFGGTRVRWLPALVALSNPLLLLARVSPMASSISDRASTFVFFAIALVVATWAAGQLGRLPRLAAAALGVLVLIGGLLLGGGPNWSLVPGPYLAGAQQRSIDTTSLAAARWAGEHFPAGSLFAGDNTMNDLIPDYADAQPVTASGGRANVSPIYYSPTVSNQVVSLIRRERIEFVVVDTRLAGATAKVGSLYEPTSTNGYDRAVPTRADLAKFDAAPGFVKVYSGPVEIFDVRPLLGIHQPLADRSLAVQPDTSVWWQMPLALGELLSMAVLVGRRRPTLDAAVLALLAGVSGAMALGAVGAVLDYPPAVGIGLLTVGLGCLAWPRRQPAAKPEVVVVSWSSDAAPRLVGGAPALVPGRSRGALLRGGRRVARRHGR